MSSLPKCAVLIVAAGHGVRAGAGLPKQYRLVAGRPVLRRTIEAFAGHPGVSLIQVVISPEHREFYEAATVGMGLPVPVHGGDTRQASVLAGLEALRSGPPGFVLIHDAARALVSQQTISSVIAALQHAEAAVPVIDAADTLKRIQDSHVELTVPRERMVYAQTPQGFHFEKIMSLHLAARGKTFTDDASIAEAGGIRVAAVPGEKTNFKLTTPEDFVIAESLLARAYRTRTGQGFDVHAFAAGDHVWLCGVRVAHSHGLAGHSDADVGLHALTDALLATIAAGDIGKHFPPSDSQWKGAASHIFLSHATKLIREQSGQIEHVDVTLICEAPKIAPYRDAMCARIAEILEIDRQSVSVKATTTEGLGFTGRKEGIAAQAIATVRLP